MNTLFLQLPAPMPPGAPADFPVIGFTLMIVNAAMVIAGTVLGFHALRDIRVAGGRLGGAMLATLAAGLLPGAFIIIACAATLNELLESVVPPGQRRDEIWIPAGAGIGIVLTLLMMRAMYRKATGGTRPPGAEAQPQSRQGLANAALILTILGGLLIFTYINSPDHREVLGSFKPPQLLLLNLLVLTAGLACGIIARPSRTGTVCAWICGALLLFLVLAHT